MNIKEMKITTETTISETLQVIIDLEDADSTVDGFADQITRLCNEARAAFKHHQQIAIHSKDGQARLDAERLTSNLLTLEAYFGSTLKELAA